MAVLRQGCSPTGRILRSLVGFSYAGVVDHPAARQSKFASRQFEMAHGDAHVHPREVCEVQQPEEQAPFAIALGSLKKEVPYGPDSDDSPRLFV